MNRTLSTEQIEESNHPSFTALNATKKITLDCKNQTDGSQMLIIGYRFCFLHTNVITQHTNVMNQ